MSSCELEPVSDVPAESVTWFRESLDTIAAGWGVVVDPGRAAGSARVRRAAATDAALVASVDVPLRLHGLVRMVSGRWPDAFTTMERLPVPSTDHDEGAWWVFVPVVHTIDPLDVRDLCWVLHVNAARVVQVWGAPLVAEVTECAKAVSAVVNAVYEPRVELGGCPSCGAALRTKPRRWDRGRITCPGCRVVWTYPGLASGQGLDPLVTAKEAPAMLKARIGVNPDWRTVLKWMRDGLVPAVGSRPLHARLSDVTKYAIEWDEKRGKLSKRR